ncbi:2-aminoethylphosphonate aminotransferase [Salinisphaera aquimarina]|uniref:2-aminoethylphosphonate--pyruvate transaminase n=1 Tax=Salinisphaera aquimarina TaxID=2094031 RepID=A0ABV7EVY9_9GAMM
MILLNPGPVTLTERVRSALTAADLCHREVEFADLQDTIRTRLRAVYDLDERWAAVVLSGSGTAAVEAMISSLPGADARLLIIENGVYGERMTRMAHIHGIAHQTLRFEWGEHIDSDRLAAQLTDGDFTHVAVVHHETTTGRLNDLAAIGEVCAMRNVQMLIDGVSSFGAEAIDFDRLPVAAVAATANKCLHGAPGAAFVLVRRVALSDATPCSLYLDLAGYCEKQDARSTPFTPAIPAFHALAEALAEHEDEGGWQARRANYRRLAGQVADGFSALGIQAVLDADESSCVLRAYALPVGIDYDALHDHLKSQGFVIYAGQGGLAASIFRISTMGAIDTVDIERLITAVSSIVHNRL